MLMFGLHGVFSMSEMHLHRHQYREARVSGDMFTLMAQHQLCDHPTQNLSMFILFSMGKGMRLKV